MRKKTLPKCRQWTKGRNVVCSKLLWTIRPSQRTLHQRVRNQQLTTINAGRQCAADTLPFCIEGHQPLSHHSSGPQTLQSRSCRLLVHSSIKGLLTWSILAQNVSRTKYHGPGQDQWFTFPMWQFDEASRKPRKSLEALEMLRKKNAAAHT